MQSFLKLTSVQWKLFLREPVAFFFNLLFPLLFLLLLGLVWGNDPFPGAPFGFVDVQVPALSAIVIGTVGFLTVPVSTATMREQKVLRRFKATPMSPFTYFAADVTIYYIIAVVGMALLVIVGKLVFGLRFEGSWFEAWAAFSLATFGFTAAGYVLASLAATSRIAQVVGQVLYFPMMFLSGAAIPLQTMPEGVRNFAEWLPLTQVVLLMQNIWFGEGWHTTAVWMILGFLVFGTIISVRIFRWE